MTSKTFCVMPFLHQNLKHAGRVCACWRHQTPLGNSHETPLSEIFNNEETKKLRSELLSGIQSEGCRSCWDLEASGVASTRIETLNNWIIEDGKMSFKIKNMDVEPSNTDNLASYINDRVNDDFSYPLEELKSIEVRFDNVCNLMCRHCSPEYSSLWSKAVKRSPELYSAVQQNVNIQDNYKSLTDNIIDDIEKFAPHLQEILITGGEPLYHDKHYEFLQKLEPYANNIILNYNSNLSTLEYKGKSILSLWKKFRQVGVLVSIDATPDIYPYIRVQGNINNVEKNIKLAKETLSNLKLQATCTTSVLNITRIVDVFKYFINLNVRVHTSLVQYPASLNPRILPRTLKDRITTDYNKFIKELDETPELHVKDDKLIGYYQWRIKSVGDKVINYMNAKDLYDTGWEKFILYMKSQDNYNNTNILDYYPEFAEYWHD